MSNFLRAYSGIDVRNVKDPVIRTHLLVMDLFLRDLVRNTNLTTDFEALLSSGGASAASSFVTVSSEVGLSDERVLTAGTAIGISDAGPGSTITINANVTTPAIVLGTVAAAGVAGSLIRSDATIAAFDVTVPADLAGSAATGSIAFAARRDHVHKFPTTLKSAANGFTVVLTDDGADNTLTNSNGNLFIKTPSGFSFQTTGNPVTVATVVGTPGSGTTTILAPQWAAGNPNTTFRCWNAFPPTGGVWTTATFVGYDAVATTITGVGGSDANNKAYLFRGSGPVIAGTNAGYTELAGLFLEGVRRVITSGTVTQAGGIILECPTIGTDQYGIWIKNRTAQLAATNRYGIKIDVQNSGTNQWAIHAGNRVHIESPSAQATTALLLRQLATGATAGAHINFDDKAGNPGSPNAGDLWRNGTALNYRIDGSTTVDLVAAGAAGDNIRVNSTAATDADFEDLLPAPPTALSSFTGLNVKWQIDTAATPDDISGYIGKDINGNWMVSFSPTASAVNYVGIVNSATGIGPQILAQGTDSSVNLRLGGFGTAGHVMSNTSSPAGGSEVVARNIWANHFVMMGT